MSALLLAVALAAVPGDTTQLVTTWVADDDASHGLLQRWERHSASEWVAVGGVVPVWLGRHGVAWGRGLHQGVEPTKVEGDGRAPMGLFWLGTAFHDPPDRAPASGWPTHPVTLRDLWVEDPAHPAYNTHVRVPDDRAMTPWEVDQRMRLGDPAHRLKVVVAHNVDPPVPGQGSAIFLHIWRRDGAAPTAGCTALPAPELEELVGWLDPAARPVYALLTSSGWGTWGGRWGLPTWVDPGSSRPSESP